VRAVAAVSIQPHPRAFAIAPRAEAREHWRVHPAPALEFVVGDITREASDAIVNPAGPGLVDLMIRQAAGPALLEAFHRAAADLPDHKLSPGQAIVTPGFELRAAHVIHCRPPIYADDPTAAREQLVAGHVQALRLARERRFASISFPAIGTGVYRYPVDRAAEVAVGAVLGELRADAAAPSVRFVFADRALLDLYLQAARVRLNQDPMRSDRGASFRDLGRR
jgi:O-acetyl-ADP-ribose deacetylase (regulator of RNase III)